MTKKELPKTSDNFTLTAKHSRAIGFLLTCRTIADAAEKSGVTERTIFSWMQIDAFRLALRNAGSASIDQTSRRLADGQAVALDTLSALITEAKGESVRRAAAVDWLNLVLKYRDLNELDERITEIERLLEI
jgi:hypothetical protein